MSPRQPLIHNQPQNPEGRVKVVLVLRQGTGLALSALILPSGCSQKKVASLMNTLTDIVRCYEVTADGIRAVDVPYDVYFHRYADRAYSTDLTTARVVHTLNFRPQKPRVTPRMAVGVAVA